MQIQSFGSIETDRLQRGIDIVLEVLVGPMQFFLTQTADRPDQFLLFIELNPALRDEIIVVLDLFPDLAHHLIRLQFVRRRISDLEKLRQVGEADPLEEDLLSERNSFKHFIGHSTVEA